jgi:hypothetical protein
MNRHYMDSNSFEAMAAAIANVPWLDTTVVPPEERKPFDPKKRADWLQKLLDFDGPGNKAKRRQALDDAHPMDGKNGNGPAPPVDSDRTAIDKALDAIFELDGTPHNAKTGIPANDPKISLWRFAYDKVSERMRDERIAGQNDIKVLLEELINGKTEVATSDIEAILDGIPPPRFAPGMGLLADEQGY